MIPTYNSGQYLRTVLRSVLAQDPGSDKMQIEVVDDGSTQDDPAPVVEEVGGDRISLYRQAQNVGNVANFNTCVQRAAGDLVHILHGDDWVLPGFYATMEQPFSKHPEIGAAFCRYFASDESGERQWLAAIEQPHAGILHDWLRSIASGQRLQPPAMVVRRSVYERLGGYDARLSGYAEDWEMWVRIAAHYPVWYEPQPLAVYRVRESSLSGGLVRTGRNLELLKLAVQLNKRHLPPEQAESVSAAALESAALAALRRANRLYAAGERTAALAQVVGASRTWMSPRIAAAPALSRALPCT
jgi:GT2 family glycosyltransferase